MAKRELNSKVIYQVFVRDFPKDGTLSSVLKKIDYFKKLGVDILYLMPIYPISKINRKGSYGSPYAIANYKKIDPSLGTLNDLKKIILSSHEKGIKVMLDMVFNHSGCDNNLLKESPDFYLKDDKGNFTRKVADWSDVYDFDYQNKKVTKYFCSILNYYADLGIDGFRFDVGSLLPPSFYKSARRYLGSDSLFLVESISPDFLSSIRSHGYKAYSNAELAEASCDTFYNYASFVHFTKYMQSRSLEDLNLYKLALNDEENNLPSDNSIVRTLENHDNKRICSYSKKMNVAYNLSAYSFFTRGPAFIYQGQEVGLKKYNSLFEKETINLDITNKKYFDFYKKLISLKQRKENINLLTSYYPFTEENYMLVINTYKDQRKEYGLFNFTEKDIDIKIDHIEDGEYLDLLSNKKITIKKGKKLTLSSPLYLQEIK